MVGDPNAEIQEIRHWPSGNGTYILAARIKAEVRIPPRKIVVGGLF